MGQLDLLLINAPSRVAAYGALTRFAAIEPPVWAGLIARAALNAGFTVKILDAEAEGLTIEATAHIIRDINPRLAAFSIYGQQPSASTQCLPAASLVVAEVRRLCTLRGDPIISTLAFGTHPSALPERTLRGTMFDFVAVGEAHTIVPLLRALRFQGNRVDLGGSWLVDVPGIRWKRQPFFQSAPNIVNLDATLPGQAWDLLDMSRYRAHNWHLWTGNPSGGYASVQTSLGCPFRCSFCCINAPFGGSSIRYWSVDNVIDQINVLARNFEITNIKIPDEMFTLNPSRVKAICNGLIRQQRDHNLPQLNMWAYARIDTVKDAEMLTLMRQAGFRWLGLGIESGSKHVRDGVEKGRFDNEDIHSAVNRVRDAGIAVGANYIFGLPDDTLESMQRTFDLACEVNSEWANFYCAMAYPGSALHVQFTRENPAVLPENNPCGWIGYAQHAYECLPLPTTTLSPQQVLDFRDDAFLRYFTRDAYLCRIQECFGSGAVDDVMAMISFGRPRRAHREN